MTIIDEGKQLRNEVAKLRPDKRRRYSDDLRRRILDWLARCNAAGIADFECSKVIGMKSHRFTMWRRQEARLDKEERESLALVPIESPLLAIRSPIVLVTPSGYRVEGLAVEQLAVLLREVA